MVLAETGEETIVSCTRCSYAANIERAEFKRSKTEIPFPDQKTFKPLQKVLTPNQRTVEDVTQFLNVSAADLVKTLIFVSDKGPVAALVRGDHEINEKKLKIILGTDDLQLADEQISTFRRWPTS
jgi:prolyl-tRNA synthetase